MLKCGNNCFKTPSENSIAVIYAQGEIMDGEGDVDIIGEGSMPFTY